MTTCVDRQSTRTANFALQVNPCNPRHGNCHHHYTRAQEYNLSVSSNSENKKKLYYSVWSLTLSRTSAIAVHTTIAGGNDISNTNDTRNMYPSRTFMMSRTPTIENTHTNICHQRPIQLRCPLISATDNVIPDRYNRSCGSHLLALVLVPILVLDGFFSF